MRILNIVRSLRRETGGLAEFVRAVSPALAAAGHEVRILSLDPADVAADGPPVIAAGRSSHGYGYSPDYVPWLRTHRREFDTVVVHGLWQYPTFGAWRALAGTDTPYLVSCHGMLDPWFKRTHPLKHAKKWLYWPWAEYRVLRDAAAVCFTCEEERRLARESFCLYRARERVAPIGIAAPPAETGVLTEALYTAYPNLRHTPFLLFLGRIHPKKGIGELLEAYATAHAKNASAPTLVIAGPSADPEFSTALRRRAQALGLAQSDFCANPPAPDEDRPARPRVCWLPMLTGAVKWGALHACEAFVLLSHQENFGLAVVEALACGRPVLFSDQINIWREIISDGAGWAAPDTVTGGIGLLARWRDLPNDQRTAMSTAATACFSRRYVIEKAAAALASVVEEAVSKTRSD